MTQLAVLDNVSHKNLKVNRTYAPGHGYDVNVARAYPAEFGQLQREYPLFFVKNSETGHFEPTALLGFSSDENLFLGDGHWQAACVPLTIERQPLLIGFQNQVSDGVPVRVPVVHIDLDHPSVSDTDGEPLFLPHGGESPLLERMTSVLKTIHDGLEAIESLSQTLVGLELIESLSLEIRFADDSKHTLSGLFTINEEKLAGLGGNALEVLHKKGHLRDVYMMIASLPNLEGLIQRKNIRLAAAQ